VNERLVLVDSHPVYFTAPEISVTMTRSILDNSCDPRFGSPCRKSASIAHHN
jgi:hypothetical protein